MANFMSFTANNLQKQMLVVGFKSPVTKSLAGNRVRFERPIQGDQERKAFVVPRKIDR